MKVTFKSPVSIDGVDFQKGPQEVPDRFANHWYLLALVQNGTASVTEEAKKASKPAKAPELKPTEPKFVDQSPEKKAMNGSAKPKRVRPSRAKAKAKQPEATEVQ